MTQPTLPPEVLLRSRVYHTVMKGYIAMGRAPHYVEIGHELGLKPEEARLALHDLVSRGGPNWLVPNTDYISTFAPFSSVPTAFLISVDGQQRWYAQCGFEALAISWLFPGREVRLDCPCLDCGEGIVVRMRDGVLLEVNPPTAVGHINVPRWRWHENIAFA